MPSMRRSGGARPTTLSPLLLPTLFLLLRYGSVSSNATFLGELENEIIPWKNGLAAGPSVLPVENGSYPLAADRTTRKDPLYGYKYYTGGWNISSRHYWASVGFTAVPYFVIAVVWFLVFGLVLLLLGLCCCFCRRRIYSYSRNAYVLSLVLVILFACAAIVGSVVLYVGQGNFHASTTKTLDYVVGQANFTVDNLRNLSSNLGAAKGIDVDHVFLPADVQTNIDTINAKLNVSANDLDKRASDSSKVIRNVLDTMGIDLIVVAAFMLVLAVLGFVFSILGLQFLVYILVIIGWVILACTFILCGVFLLFHNVVADTCMAMEDWVEHPHEHTALSEILPCVDSATSNDTLYQTKQVTFQLVNVVNQVLTNVSNRDYSPVFGPLYYNQSGPLVPLLCNPYLPDMSNRTCAPGEVDFNNASQVWKGYTCNATDGSGNGSETCTNAGRLTPSLYGQMMASASVSQGLYYYGPFLVQLEDCTFVHDTFASIVRNGCPNLGRFSQWIYTGLAVATVAVMLSLIFWVIYARERRHRKRTKELLAATVGPNMQPFSMQGRSP